ncbi:MAG: helix-turn-helix transcriptional regulator [Ruminococcaceae bacterium]|nr:helix-turn-helix transcriptional regulator [Oscillospiraceae bacterium]
MNKNYKRGKFPSLEYVNNAVDSEYFILVSSAGCIENEKERSDGTGKGYLLLFLEKGMLSVTLRDEECIINGGQAIIFSPDSFYEVKDICTSCTSVYYYVSFMGTATGQLLDHASLTTDALIDISGGLADSFKKLFKDFEEYSESRDIAMFDILAPSHLLEMIAEIKARSSEIVYKYPLSSRIAGSVEYMKRNYNIPLCVEEIALKHNFSPSYFRKQFKRATGLSPLEYLTELRIGHACQMLLWERSGIEEVAQSCGFQSLSYFGKIFKRKTGQSPTEYKKNNVKT